MKKSRFPIILIAICATVLLIISGLFLLLFERTDKTVFTPMYGEAAIDDLYLFKQLLKKQGISFKEHRVFSFEDIDPNPNDTIIFYKGVGGMDAAAAGRLMEWVEDGGHVVLSLESNIRNYYSYSNDSEEWPIFLKNSGIPSMERKNTYSCEKLTFNGLTPIDIFCNSIGFTLKNNTPVIYPWIAGDAFVYARLPRGQGFIDALIDFDFLSNGRAASGIVPPPPPKGQASQTVSPPNFNAARDGLREPVNRLFMQQVLAPNYGNGVIHIVHLVDIRSLWGIIYQNYWAIWVPLLLSLFFLLWKKAQRFGPLLPTIIPERRSLLEHIQASGIFLFRNDEYDILYQSVKNQFLNRLKQSQPMIASLTEEAKYTAIAEHLNMPISTVKTALTPLDEMNPLVFQQRIATLIQMRNLL